MNIADRYSKPPQMRRILIIQLGDIGDVVWSLPALQAVRDAYPGAAVAVLLREGSGSLLAASVSPPKIFEVRKGNPVPGEACVVHSARSGTASGTVRPRLRLSGETSGGIHDLPDRGADPRRPPLSIASLAAEPSVHPSRVTYRRAYGGVGAADQALFILRAFGIETGKDAVPELHLSEEVRLRAAKILADEGIPAQEEAMGRGGERMRAGTVRPGGWVTLNPFSRWSYKEWGLLKWVQIIDWLWGEFGIAAVIVGAPAERERAGELGNSCAGKVYNLAGKTTLAELAGVLQRSRLHIGVDSAAPHIAAAVGTPTVTLYGPSDWRYWAPPGERNRVVVPEMACAPCHLKGCEGSGVSRCLDTLPVERVQAVIDEALSV